MNYDLLPSFIGVLFPPSTEQERFRRIFTLICEAVAALDFKLDQIKLS
jgi:hypothetical protein